MDNLDAAKPTETNAPGSHESQPEQETNVIAFRLENIDELWELIKNGTNTLKSKSYSGTVRCGSILGNLGSYPMLSLVKGRLKVEIEVKKQTTDEFYKVAPTGAMQQKLDKVMPGIVVDGSNLYAKSDSKQKRIAFREKNNFVYAPDSEITNAKELEAHLTLAATIYSGYAAVYYESEQLPVPKDELILGPKELVLAEAGFEERTGETGQKKDDMFLTEKPNTHFEDIGGQDRAVATCSRFAEQLRFADIFAMHGSKPPRGILLWGPPGTGKTLMAKAIATEADAVFMHVQAGDVSGNGLYGQSEKAASQIFTFAKKAAIDTKKHVIIFIDEGDLLLPKPQTTGRHEATSKTVGIFAQGMDGIKAAPDITVIIATNEPQNLDPRILSRMDESEEVPRPDAVGLETILKIHLQKLHVNSRLAVLGSDVNLHELASQAYEQGLSGRDVADVVGLVARSRGLEQLERLRSSIKSGRISNPDSLPEQELIKQLGSKIAGGDLTGIEDLVLGNISQAELMQVLKNAKTMLKAKKARLVGFPAHGRTE